jgi:UDP-glucose 4-epimerase
LDGDDDLGGVVLGVDGCVEILVTGGSGYKGSHCCVTLLVEDYDIVVLDNFSNSSEVSLSKFEKLLKKNLHL